VDLFNLLHYNQQLKKEIGELRHNLRDSELLCSPLQQLDRLKWLLLCWLDGDSTAVYPLSDLLEEMGYQKQAQALRNKIHE
jgi:hypothetical protein